MNLTQKYKIELGAKVKKNGMAGHYTYFGKNFTANFNEVSCESTWWEVDVYSPNTSDIIKHMFDNLGGNEENRFGRKSDCLYALLCTDKDIEESK